MLYPKEVKGKDLRNFQGLKKMLVIFGTHM